MAAVNAVTLDTLISIKLQAGNENRRFKLPLKDLGPNTLPSKLRALLALPQGKTAIFERFSDSAGSYITLDSDDISVYKQLHRAAKAKLKLRIKATICDVLEPKAEFTVPTQTASNIPSKSPMGARSAVSNDSVEPLEQAQAQLQAIRAQLEAQQQVQMDHMNTLAQQTADRVFRPQQDVLLHNHGYAMQMEGNLDRPSEIQEAILAPDTSSNGSCHSLGYNKNLSQFSVCCNKCHENIPGAHWHCSICMDGDYDLCPSCIDLGHHCQIDYHFLIKRIIENGRVINSTTFETVPKKPTKVESPTKSENQLESMVHDEHHTPKERSKYEVVRKSEAQAEPMVYSKFLTRAKIDEPVNLLNEVPGAYTEVKEELSAEDRDMCRTCNACVNIFEESNFVTCMECEDYDLCIDCHIANKHGHHPGHEFAPVIGDINLEPRAKALCSPGRKTHHFAICDGCDKDISGVRHKCLNCPDWDYCSDCIGTSILVHPGHRFVPIYETIVIPTTAQAVHYGVRCDGPLCQVKSRHSFIVGDRYKCAVCHDTDFCASCEALPVSTHNRTHPLIKFRTQVRNVSVTTLNERDGAVVDALGDQLPQTSSKSTETTPAAPSANAATQVQTVAEVKPVAVVNKATTIDCDRSPLAAQYQAHFASETVPDGTRLAPNTVFEQVWTVVNPGPLAWPVGCSLRFKGGDRMLNVDSDHPASIGDFTKAISSKPTDHVVEVGEYVNLEMILKAPAHAGKAISYWKLVTADGLGSFGHKLWCHIEVDEVEENLLTALEPLHKYLVDRETAEVKSNVEDDTNSELQQSQMIFPTLEKESASSSFHDASSQAVEVASSISPDDQHLLDDLENMALEEESSDDGFLTDEEYDILDNDFEAGAATNGKA